MTLLLIAWKWLRGLPWQVYAAAGLCVLVLWLRGHWIGVGVERCQSAQEAAEADGLANAKEAGKQAQAKAQAATKDIAKESTDAAEQVREIVRYLPASCPPMPDQLHDVLKRQAERANSGVQAGG